MKIKYALINDELIIKPDQPINPSLSNPEILSTVIKELRPTVKQVVINSNLLRMVYDTKLLIDLAGIESKDPVNEFLEGREELKNSSLIKESLKYIDKGLNSSEIYNKLFKPSITPSFIKSSLIKPSPDYKIVHEYSVNNSEVIIHQHLSDCFYELLPFELIKDFELVKEVSRILTKVSNSELSTGDFNQSVIKLIEQEEVSDSVKRVVKRHSIGFGLLDIIFNDDFVQDIYVYSSDRRVYLTHERFGECQTNLILSDHDIKSLNTKIRVASGRPFDNSFPVIDYELGDYGVRVCGVREPLTFNGIGYAFRKHRSRPWTLLDFIENGMISSEAAGLLNFLVDGQCSILITGPRGSGKTSFLSALINEVPVNQRLIIMEDTPELPIKKLVNAGFRIQHLRVKPPLKDRSTNYELSAEEALRTALRLGESVLVVGEVRGEEAKALFEAMRVGAAGNVVLGTIHGSTVFDTFDRIVNDLKVPATSFKSTDVVVSCANLRRGESLKTNRVITSVTEVSKEWSSNPLEEEGFIDLTVFNRTKKNLSLSKELKDSALIKRVATLKGMSVNACLQSIELRGWAKEQMIKQLVPKEPSSVIKANNKIIELLGKDLKNFKKEFRNYIKEELKN